MTLLPIGGLGGPLRTLRPLHQRDGTARLRRHVGEALVGGFRFRLTLPLRLLLLFYRRLALVTLLFGVADAHFLDGFATLYFGLFGHALLLFLLGRPVSLLLESLTLLASLLVATIQLRTNACQLARSAIFVQLVARLANEVGRILRMLTARVVHGITLVLLHHLLLRWLGWAVHGLVLRGR